MSGHSLWTRQSALAHTHAWSVGYGVHFWSGRRALPTLYARFIRSAHFIVWFGAARERAARANLLAEELHPISREIAMGDHVSEVDGKGGEGGKGGGAEQLPGSAPALDGVDGRAGNAVVAVGSLVSSAADEATGEASCDGMGEMAS